MINRPEEYEKMDLVEKELWWYKILHEQTCTAIQKKFLNKDIAILDAACGTGGFIQYLKDHGFTKIKGFDLSQESVVRSQRKTGCDIAQLDIQQASHYYPPQSFDVVICNDALYFFSGEEFRTALSGLLNLVKEGGLLIINLPAGEAFKGMHDRAVGIRERWNYKKFKHLLSLSGVAYKAMDYWNWPFVLSPFIWITRVMQRLKLLLYPSAEVKSDVVLPSFGLNNIFYKLTKWERYLPFNKKMGSSIFIVIHR